jgi:hypothetical protein
MHTGKKYELAVAYRVYPGVSKAPFIYGDSKEKLAGLAAASFASALVGVKAKIWILLDACPDDYVKMFSDIFRGYDLEIIRLSKTGNYGTFGLQLDILLKQEDSDWIYFAEDDYLYVEGAMRRALDFAHISPGFVTLYDHSDNYNLKIHRRKASVAVHGDQYWRSAQSTCMTFLTSKKVLMKTEQIFRSYCKRNYDVSIWLAITKCSIFRLHNAFDKDPSRRFWLIAYLKLWYFGWTDIFFRRRLKLLNPMPSLATHMEKTGLAPVVNWFDVAEKITKQSK